MIASWLKNCESDFVHSDTYVMVHGSTLSKGYRSGPGEGV